MNAAGAVRAAPAGREPIAIVGIGCRFPGADGPRAFWRLLCEGVDAISEVPPERFDLRRVYDPSPGTPGKIASRWGGFLRGIDRFDAAFFGISPREAARMDPQQRLLLEVAWEALEDAGLVAERLAGSRTGVFVGMCYGDYEDLELGDPQAVDLYVNTGGARNIASGRISFAFGFEGPSLTVDAACSSSLVTVHLACQSLWGRESVLALAGGANLILQPQFSIGFSQAAMLSPGGRCRAFDAGADGFVRSEGVALLVLKPLARALADGDPIYALIRGSAVNNDGRSSGLLMTPGRPGQEAVLRQAYADAGLPPAAVQYVEAHGTGTRVGDPVEAAALGAVLGQGRDAARPLAVGSVKSNIGHTEGTAGVAGLIKVALALRERRLPPSLHVRTPNPEIPWRELGLEVCRELRDWPADARPARAGVSSFGISGTNAHVVLEEAPAPPAPAPPPAGPVVLALSARSPEALAARAHAILELLGDASADADLHDLCYTAAVRRAHHDHRLAIVAAGREPLAARLSAFLAGELGERTASGVRPAGPRRKVVFLFPGQGSQWLGMGRELRATQPVFRAALERCAAAIASETGWSLLAELDAAPERSRLEQVDVVQPALFAMQVALAALWRHRGIEPDAVVGQSLGEVAAAHVAGILSLEDAARVICRRSLLVRAATGGGAMAVAALSLDGARAAIRGHEDRLAVAVHNGPASTVLSGEPECLDRVLAALAAQGVFCRRVKVDYASHSPQMDPLLPEIRRRLAELRPGAATVAFHSTVTGGRCAGPELDAAYWARNLRQTVLFAGAIERLLAGEHEVFVEVSPHPLLLGAVQQLAAAGQREVVLLPSGRREEAEPEVLLGSLAGLYAAGVDPDWERLHAGGAGAARRVVVPLPAYPWQRERFWLEPPARGRGAPALSGDGAGHPLLGEPFRSALDPERHFFQAEIGLEACPELADHLVGGRAVLPAASYLEMALWAAERSFPGSAPELREVVFVEALLPPAAGTRPLQLVLAPHGDGEAAFQFLGLAAADTAAAGPAWTLHAAGRVSLAPPAGAGAEGVSPPGASDLAPPGGGDRGWLPEEVQARCREVLAKPEIYRAAARRGLAYGPAFQRLERLWRGDGEALGLLSELPGGSRYRIDPGLLDACLQVVLGALPEDLGERLLLPVAVGSLRAAADAGEPRFCHARLRDGSGPSGALRADLSVLDASGHIAVELFGLELRASQAPVRAPAAELAGWLFGMEWEAQEAPEPPMAAVRGAQDAPLPAAAATAAVAEPKTEDAPLPAAAADREARDLQSPAASAVAPGGCWLILADAGGAGGRLAARLAELGERTLLAYARSRFAAQGDGRFRLAPGRPQDFHRLARELAREPLPLRGLVHLFCLDAEPAADLASLRRAQELGPLAALHAVQALAATAERPPRLWLVTRGAQAVGPDDPLVAPAQAPLWGFARSLAHEQPGLAPTVVDLDPAAPAGEIEQLCAELRSGSAEAQVAFRGGRRWVARLVRTAAAALAAAPPAAGLGTAGAGGGPFRLESAGPGLLERLEYRPLARRPPAPGEVEIEVEAAGLNFRDVMLALGIYPGGGELGLECAGRVARTGDQVTGFAPGDEVIAFAPPCFGSFAYAPAAVVAGKPHGLSFAEAATIPAAFVTAHYALCHLGRIQPGERVLIHQATGGVGQAAIQLARRAGAEVLATAGSPEKRQLLRSWGIEHVMDSRSLAFAAEVRDATGGAGVDLVLSALRGEAIAAGLAALAPFGRFLDLSKSDPGRAGRLDRGALAKSLAYFVIDVDAMLAERPVLLGELLREVVAGFADGSLAPLPWQGFPAAAAVDAFRLMAKARHTGKLVLSLAERAGVTVRTAASASRVRRDGTYLVSGGLGGLGVAVARWLAEQGAGGLLLLGRAAPSPAAAAAIEEMRATGSRVLAASADVTVPEELAAALATAGGLPPLRGVVHAAGVLADALVASLDRAAIETVAAPKILGAWNLHTATLASPLDFFVLFSSAASLLGSPGQAGYAAANAFLDALAHYRRSRGLPGLAINWGPWAEIGLAARPDRGGRLAARGLASLQPRDGVAAFGRLLATPVAQVGVMPFDVERWRELYPASAASPYLSRLAAPADRIPDRDGRLSRGKLLSVAAPERESLLVAYLGAQTARVVGLSASGLQRLDPGQPLQRLGLDSLMAVELKNRIEADLGVGLPLRSFLQGANLRQVCAQLLEQLPAAASGAEERWEEGEV